MKRRSFRTKEERFYFSSESRVSAPSQKFIKSANFVSETKIEPIFSKENSQYVSGIKGKPDIVKLLSTEKQKNSSQLKNKSKSLSEKRKDFLETKNSGSFEPKSPGSKIIKLSSDDEDNAALCLSIDELTDCSETEETEVEIKNEIEKTETNLSSEEENEEETYSASDSGENYLDFFLSSSKTSLKKEKQTEKKPKLVTSMYKSKNDDLRKDIERAKKALRELEEDSDSYYSDPLTVEKEQDNICKSIRRNQIKNLEKHNQRAQSRSVLSSKRTIFPKKRTLLTQQIIPSEESSPIKQDYSSLYTKPKNHLTNSHSLNQSPPR